MWWVIVAVAFVLLGGAVVLLLLLLPDVRRALLEQIFGGQKKGMLPYESREFLLSKGEAAFYHTLLKAAGDRYAVFAKVRLVDILKPPSGDDYRRQLNRILSKHIDFVLTEPATTKIIAAIELDDRSHRRQSRRERDVFLDDAMQAAGVLLVRFPARAQYDVATLRQELSTQLDGAAHAGSTTGQAVPPVARRSRT